MNAVLRVDASGRVVALDAAARELLGPVRGLRCCDAVLARCGRRLACVPGCAPQLLAGEARADQHAIVRGRPTVLGCVAVGEEVVVVLAPGVEVTGEPLTVREREVLAQVARGASKRAIAARLGLHPSTVRTHVEHAREKLGARTRAEAVAQALARGELCAVDRPGR